MTISIIDDNVLEDDEAFQLELSVPEGEPVTLLQPSHRAVIKILNDDGKFIKLTTLSSCNIHTYNINAKFPSISLGY